IPAAACGTVGLKPTFGEVSVGGVVPLSTSLDHLGPLAATVSDAWHLFRAMVDGDPGDPLPSLGVSGLRLGVLRPYFCDVLDDDVRGHFERAPGAVREAGAVLDAVAIAHTKTIAPIYMQMTF